MNAIESIQRYLLGEATEVEVAELERRLVEDAALRRLFVMEAGMDAGLRKRPSSL